MNGGKLNAMTKALLNAFAKSLQPVFKKCPMMGHKEITVKFEEQKNFISMLPSGFYEIGEEMYDDDDDDMFSCSWVIKIS